MRTKIILGCVLPLLLIGLLLYVGARAVLKAKPQLERSEVVTRGNVEIKVVETGVVEPVRRVEVKSKVGGRVEKLFVDEGAVVRRGQVLATIDPTEVNSQVAALKEQWISARAHLAATRKGAIYQQDLTRTSITQYAQNLEAARARLKVATAEARVQPELTHQAIAMAEASLESAQSALKAQQTSLKLMQESTHPQALVSAQSGYDQARAQVVNAQRNLERQKQLLAKGFVSQQAADTAQTEVEVAQARERETKEHLNLIRQTNTLEVTNQLNQIANLQSQVRQQQAALSQARNSVLPDTKRAELESARAACAQAQAQLDSARSGRTQDLVRQNEVEGAEAQMRQFRNQLDELQVRKADTTLVASMGGVVTKRYVEAGELITSAIATFSSGMPVFQISDLHTMLVKISPNEVDVARLKPGMLTEVVVDAARGAHYMGYVERVAPASATATGAQTGNSGASGNAQEVVRFSVQVRLRSVDSRVRPGMSARCTIFAARRKAVLRLPTNCVQGEGDRATVQIVTSTVRDGRTVETTAPRPVKVGLKGEEYVEILSGLKEGEKVRPIPYKGPARKNIDMTFD